MNWGALTGPTLAWICPRFSPFTWRCCSWASRRAGARLVERAREAEALDLTVAQRRNELEELNERLERRSSAERRASAIIEEAEKITGRPRSARPHEGRATGVRGTGAPPAGRSRDAACGRARTSRSDGTGKRSQTDVQFGGSDEEWAEKIRKRKEELVAFEEKTAEARAELMATRAEKRQHEEEARRAKERNRRRARTSVDAYQAKLEKLKESDQAKILEAIEEKLDAANAELDRDRALRTRESEGGGTAGGCRGGA